MRTLFILFLIVAAPFVSSLAEVLPATQDGISTIDKSKLNLKDSHDNAAQGYSGWRLGIAVPRLNTSVYDGSSNDVNGNNPTPINVDGKSGADLALSVGYTNFAANKIGYLTTLNLTTFSKLNSDKRTVYKVLDSDYSATHLRAELNAAYGINNKLYSYAGVNSGKFLDEFKTLDPNLGIQAALGYKFNSRISTDIKWISMRQKGQIAGWTGQNLEISGLEFGVNALF